MLAMTGRKSQGQGDILSQYDFDKILIPELMHTPLRSRSGGQGKMRNACVNGEYGGWGSFVSSPVVWRIDCLSDLVSLHIYVDEYGSSYPEVLSPSLN